MAKNNDTGARSTNMITSGTSIVGDVVCNNDIRIEGALTGNLKVEGKVVIGGTGSVKGEVTCQNCDIEGGLDGKITVTELLALRATAKVTGDIFTSKLAIEPGATFTGLCNMDDGSNKKPQNNNPEKK